MGKALVEVETFWCLLNVGHFVGHVQHPSRFLLKGTLTNKTLRNFLICIYKLSIYIIQLTIERGGRS
jgi:hypothetical protein